MAWRWLTRMRTALYILGVLGLLTLLATVVPQEPNVAGTVASWRAGTEGPGTTVSALIDALGAYDVYGSPAFLALLLLLFLSLTACLIPRIRAWWKLTTRGRPPASRDLRVHPHVVTFHTDLDAVEVEAATRRLMRGRRFRLRASAADEPSPSRTDVAGERGIVSREGGSLAFHVSFYVLLVAVIMGQLLGFTGQVGVVEGSGFSDAGIAYWNTTPGRWWDDGDHRGFTLTLDEFHVDWHREGPNARQPKLFESEVTVTTADGDTFSDTIGGNDPLIVDGMKIHQLEWGYAPRIVVEVDGQVVHDAYLTSSQTDGPFFRTAVKAPGADPDVGLDVQLYPTAVDPDGNIVTDLGYPWADAPLLVMDVYRGDLRLDRVQNVNRLDLTGLQGAGGLLVPLGQSVSTPDGVTVSFPELRYWAGFQVSHRPTTPWLLLGAAMMLVGLVPALYAYRRRVWVRAEADESGAGTLVTVAGRAFQRPEAFVDEFDDLVERLRTALAATAPAAPSETTDDLTPDDLSEERV